MSNFTAPADVFKAMPRSFEYAVVDVFAERALEGNPLAIFTDARGLSPDEMQSLARETNLCETTFILPRDPAIEQIDGVQVRIFTVKEELKFAGHPTLGTASWLYWNHPVLRGAESITLDLPVGPITVRFTPPASGGVGVFGTMHQNDPVFGSLHDPAEIAALFNLSSNDIDLSHPIQTVSTGMAFCIVPLRSLAVAARLQISPQASQTYLQASDAKFFFCITPADPSSGADWHARMQFYNGEDPATGSASGCAISYLVRHGLAASAAPIVIEQGIEMLRPSRIHTSATLTRGTPTEARAGTNAGTISNVFVGGRTIAVASGRFFLP